MNKFVLFLEKYLAAVLVSIFGKTWKISLLTPKPKEKVIYAFWHRNMLPLLYQHRNQNIVILISSSKDGELIAGPAELLGYKTARGSSSKKSLSAVRKLIKQGKKFDIAITPDGPKGPSEKIKEGVTFLSYFTKLPIVLVAVDVEKEKVFNSWDRFRFPHLFSKVNITYSDPIRVNSKDDIVQKREFIQQVLDDITIKNKVR